ncbi:branched-chain amino acid ABC transporter permease [Aeromicrobium phragmitis]|uniref:Branched-chain amino acid ABC transporter permease n=2 Tax=Aeromicrobium phragmitis TaxID=2478914 RepID=A0A3L8PIZ4_9ACTN|nr:branched-chain amino acid ABC transporter permease [Aeromicrobium phragmitis]
MLGAILLGAGGAYGTSPAALPSESPDNSITVVLLDTRGTEAGEPGTPVPDVDIEVSDDSGTVGEGTTDEEGRVSIPIPGLGSYTVTVDEDTLPEDTELSGEGGNERSVNVVISGDMRVQFPIADERAAGAGFVSKLMTGAVSGIKFGLIIGLAALGLSMVFGTTGLTNFSHGELITFGGLVVYGFNRGLGLPVVVAGILTVFVSAGFGWVQERGLWRPLRRRGTGLVAMMIVSIGFALFLRNVYQYVFGGTTKSLSQYVSQQRVSLGPVSLAPKEMAIIAIALVAIALVCAALMTTRLGKATRAVADNPALASSSGLRVDGIIGWVWIIGTALTGLAGVLLAVDQQVEFQMGFKMLLLVFASVTLGGLGTIWGALIGSMVVGIMVEVSPVLGVPAELKYTPALLVLILILLVRPQGILGRRERIG